MKKTRKKLLSLLLTAAVFFTAFAPAFAYDEIPVENGYAYDLWDTDDGPVLNVLWYEGEEEEAVVPITIGGVALTPENFTGSVFCNGKPVCSIRVEEGHPYFTAVDGALYTKDGKTLVFYPQTEEERYLLTIPDGVETLAWDCISYADCVVLPDSVQEIEVPAYWPEWYFSVPFKAVMAAPGGFAESWAKEHHIPFVILGEGHKHVYFHRIVTEPTCVSTGTVELWCPCGETRTVTMSPCDHWFPYDHVRGEEEGSGYWIQSDTCVTCGISYEAVYGHAPEPEYDEPDPDEPVWPVDPDDCGCVCHKFIDEMSVRGSQISVLSLLKDFFYRLQIVIWRLTGTHQYCECGERHY